MGRQKHCMAMMERGVGKIEVSFRDEHAITRTLHLDPDQTMESILDLLRELTGFSVETQVLTYQGQSLYDRRSVHDYSIKPCSTIYIKKVTRDAKRELLMQQAILWDDGCKVQTLFDEGYQITTPFATMASGPLGDVCSGAQPLHYAALCLSASSLTVSARLCECPCGCLRCSTVSAGPTYPMLICDALVGVPDLCVRIPVRLLFYSGQSLNSTGAASSWCAN